MISAIRALTPEAINAGRGLTQAVVQGIRNAGSPSEHLFYDSAVSQTQAYATGFSDAGQDVVDAATAITRAAAATTVGAGVAAGGSSGVPGSAGVGVGGGTVVNQTFNGYSPQETAAVTGREWTRLTRFSGGG